MSDLSLIPEAVLLPAERERRLRHLAQTVAGSRSRKRRHETRGPRGLGIMAGTNEMAFLYA